MRLLAVEWCLVQETEDMSNYGVVHTYVGCSEAQIDEGVIPVSLH